VPDHAILASGRSPSSPVKSGRVVSGWAGWCRAPLGGCWHLDASKTRTRTRSRIPAILREIVAYRLNVIVFGATGSGKTRLCKAIIAEIPLFERRLDFLGRCPAPGMPGDARPRLARYGATCQRATLVSQLNAQIQACKVRDSPDASICRPTGNEWRVCASLYGHGYTANEAPELHEACARVRQTNGYLVERRVCGWTEAGTEAPDLGRGLRRGVGRWPDFAAAARGSRGE
jgi:hypothetical protein